MFDSNIFSIIKNLKPSARGELEITDAIEYYVKNGRCKYSLITGYWSDAGTFESLNRASNLVKEKEAPEDGFWSDTSDFSETFKFPSRDETAPEVKPEPEKPAPEKETKNLEYKFTIQAGAFSNNTNAKALKKRFEDAGFYSEIKEKIVGGSSFHVVFVGKFLNTDEAGNFLDIINLRFSLDGRIVPID